MGLMSIFKKKSNDNIDGLPQDFDINNQINGQLGPSHDMDFGAGQQHNPYDTGPAVNLSTMGMGSSSVSMGGIGGQSGIGAQGMNTGPAHETDMQRDMQMISLKLDAIKAELDAMSQRLRHLEMIAEKDTSKNQKWY